MVNGVYYLGVVWWRSEKRGGISDGMGHYWGMKHQLRGGEAAEAREMLRVEIHRAIKGVGMESEVSLGDVLGVLREVEDDVVGMLEKKLGEGECAD